MQFCGVGPRADCTSAMNDMSLSLSRFRHRVRQLAKESSPDGETVQQFETTLRHVLQTLEDDETVDDQMYEEFQLLSLTIEQIADRVRQSHGRETQDKFENSHGREKQDKFEVEEEEQEDDQVEEKEKEAEDHGAPLIKKAQATGDVREAAVHGGGGDWDPDRDPGDASSAEKIQSLLLQQKDLTTQALEEERKSHAMLSAEVASLTSALKDATIMMSKSVQEQNVHLESLEQAATENQTELDRQQKRAKEQTKVMFTSVWTTMASVIWIVSLFIATYIVIRLFPKPQHY